MAHSDRNRPYGRMMLERASFTAQAEAYLANQIQRQTGCKRDEALRAAARIIEREKR